MSGEQEILDRIVNTVRNHMPSAMKYKVFLFGSRAAGTATERSDYDVGIEAEDRVPWEVMSRIRLDLEDLPILQMVDAVDFSSLPEEFTKTAKKKTKFLYEH